MVAVAFWVMCAQVFLWFSGQRGDGGMLHVGIQYIARSTTRASVSAALVCSAQWLLFSALAWSRSSRCVSETSSHQVVVLIGRLLGLMITRPYMVRAWRSQQISIGQLVWHGASCSATTFCSQGGDRLHIQALLVGAALSCGCSFVTAQDWICIYIYIYMYIYMCIVVIVIITITIIINYY